jgi:hypothetical protein
VPPPLFTAELRFKASAAAQDGHEANRGPTPPVPTRAIGLESHGRGLERDPVGRNGDLVHRGQSPPASTVLWTKASRSCSSPQQHAGHRDLAEMTGSYDSLSRETVECETL